MSDVRPQRLPFVLPDRGIGASDGVIARQATAKNQGQQEQSYAGGDDRPSRREACRWREKLRRVARRKRSGLGERDGKGNLLNPGPIGERHDGIDGLEEAFVGGEQQDGQSGST